VNLIDVNTAFPTDDKCRELLVRLRWPEGPQCPRCKAVAVELETEKQLFFCKDCAYQFSVTTGTVFNDSHLPLVKWFSATLLLCEAKKGISACQIQRTLGMSYKTAWYLCHRIRAAMKEADTMLDGTVEVDETYVGGKEKNKHFAQRVKGTRGRSTETKAPVFGMIQRGGDMKAKVLDDVKMRTLEQQIVENVKIGSKLYTDDFLSYSKIGTLYHHGAVRHGRISPNYKEEVDYVVPDSRGPSGCSR